MVEINLLGFLHWFLKGFSFGLGFVGSVMLVLLIWQFIKWLATDQRTSDSQADGNFSGIPQVAPYRTTRKPSPFKAPPFEFGGHKK